MGIAIVFVAQRTGTPDFLDGLEGFPLPYAIADEAGVRGGKFIHGFCGIVDDWWCLMAVVLCILCRASLN